MNSPFDLDFQNQNTDARIVAALERIAQAFRVLLWNESKEYGLSPVQIQLLIFLNFQPEDRRTVSALAQAFDLTRPTISDSVKVLEEKGLVKRITNPDDARSHSLALTAKGKKVAKDTLRFTTELQKPVKEMTADEKENLLFGLLQIIHHLNQAGVITVQRMCLGCTFYKKNYNGHAHYCKLLNTTLATSSVRLDCPDYEKIQE